MKCLVYAILNAAEIRQAPLPRGIDERALAVLTTPPSPPCKGGEGGVGLALVFSRVSRSQAPAWERAAQPDRSRLLAFARVIADLGRDRTVLPVRYGTLLENEDQAREMLRRKRAAFAAALAEVDGCVEMSLRVLLPSCQLAAAVGSGSRTDSCRLPLPTAAADCKPADGIAYILRRRTHYLNQDNARELDEGRVGRFRAAFAGLFVSCRPEEWRVGEPSRVSGRVRRYPALHFLVRRENLERFRQAFRRMEEVESDPVLLTGPWVPYNFVNLPQGGLLP